jgi:hypothetical protein
MVYTEARHNDEIEPGDFVVYTNQNNLYYGFYKGRGKDTIQVLDPSVIVWCHEHDTKPKASPIFGQSKDWRIMKSHPDFITNNREKLDRAIEIIRETKILPVKY